MQTNESEEDMVYIVGSLGAHALVAKALIDAPLYSTDSIEPENKPILFKAIGTAIGWVWTIYEAGPYEDGILFFGLVEGFETEYGYFTLEELEDAKCILVAPKA